jgi:hypothetical protein
MPLTRDESDELAEWAQECHAAQGLGMLPGERREDEAELDDARDPLPGRDPHDHGRSVAAACRAARLPLRSLTGAGVAAGTAASD